MIGAIACSALSDACRVILEPCEGGACLFVFRTQHSGSPEADYFFESVNQAKAVAESDYGVPSDGWTPWAGPTFG